MKGLVGQTEWSEHFPDCGGSSQSPVDVATTQTRFDPGLTPLTPLGYDQHGHKPFTLHNNGHTGKYGNWELWGRGGIPATPQPICSYSPSSLVTQQRSFYAALVRAADTPTFSVVVFVSVSCDRAPGLDGPVRVAVALHCSADAPPLGEWGPEPQGQRAHHQRAECRCRGMFKYS